MPWKLYGSGQEEHYTEVIIKAWYGLEECPGAAFKHVKLKWFLDSKYKFG